MRRRVKRGRFRFLQLADELVEADRLFVGRIFRAIASCRPLALASSYPSSCNIKYVAEATIERTFLNKLDQIRFGFCGVSSFMSQKLGGRKTTSKSVALPIWTSVFQCTISFLAMSIGLSCFVSEFRKKAVLIPKFPVEQAV